jgi:hypothetical protein
MIKSTNTPNIAAVIMAFSLYFHAYFIDEAPQPSFF